VKRVWCEWPLRGDASSAIVDMRVEGARVAQPPCGSPEYDTAALANQKLLCVNPHPAKASHVQLNQNTSATRYARQPRTCHRHC
jgi:hypothetical protein